MFSSQICPTSSLIITTFLVRTLPDNSEAVLSCMVAQLETCSSPYIVPKCVSFFSMFLSRHGNFAWVSRAYTIPPLHFECRSGAKNDPQPAAKWNLLSRTLSDSGRHQLLTTGSTRLMQSYFPPLPMKFQPFDEQPWPRKNISTVPSLFWKSALALKGELMGAIRFLSGETPRLACIRLR
jgi:hypothetical protein